MCEYSEELEFIVEVITSGYTRYKGQKIDDCVNKSEFDLVTSVDIEMEKYIISKIRDKYPEDVIHSEEFNYSADIRKRTWTIDPIDGTVNMACSVPLFGIQCSLLDNAEPVVGVIYLPFLNEVYTACKGQGAFLNGEKIAVAHRDLKHCVVSFGDFPHSREEDSQIEKKIIYKLSSCISKIRMFGAASIDFAFLAAGRTSATVLFTKNKWDIVPGIVICKEAGAIIKSLEGEYSFDDNVIVAASDDTIYKAIVNSSR